MVVETTATPSAPGSDGIDQDLTPGQIVGEYQVERKLGQGGFGAVFKAVHPLIGKLVAIKVLSQRFSVDPQMVSRFVAEARAVNQIRHHNIIDIFSFGALEDGRQYYVMEYLDGEPLDKRLSRGGPMALDEAIPILRAIGRALDAAHAKGIAHRDLKAENVFLAAHPDGVFPKLLDFGIAKLMAPEDGLAHKTRTGAPMGTPHYMSPEQCHGRDVDHRTDMYAFGVLAYLMLTGVYPLDGDDYMAILMRQVHDEPAPPSSHRPELPAGVNAAIGWLMRKDPASRPATLMAAVQMLERVARGDPGDETLPPPGSPGAAGTFDRPGRRPGSTPGKTASSIPPSSPSGVHTPSGIRTPEALPAAAVSGTASSGALPVVAPPRHQLPEERRPPLHLVLAGGALLAAAAIIAVIVVRSSGRDAAQAPAQAPPGSAAAAFAPPDAAAVAPGSAAVASASPDAAVPARPAHVFVKIEGAPPDTEVRLAGKLLGIAPGRVPVERSDTEVILALSADGYQPSTLQVIPSEDLTRTVMLKPRPTPRAGRPAVPPRTGGAGKPAAGSGGAGSAGAGSGEPTNEILTFPPK
jgi:serine/threonine-protein kinase